MKAISVSLALVFLTAIPGFCQAPHRALSSIFQSKLAFALPLQDSTPVSTEVVTTSSNAPTIAPNTWIEIHGTNLAPGIPAGGEIWSVLPASDFSTTLPTSLGGVSATVNNKPAAIYFVSPTQVNVLAPLDTASGPVQVALTTQYGTTTQNSVNEQSLSLAFLVIDVAKHVAAVHTAPPAGVNPIIAPPGQYPGVATTGAAPSEVVSFYATGFGQPATPITNQLTGSGALPSMPAITIAGIPATVQFAGLVAPGEYQFNVVIPANAPAGDQPLVATYNGNTTQQQGTLITIQ